MPNIMVTEECNLNCSYCFTRELIDGKKGKKKHINVKDFKEVVSFITKTHNEIGLIGGETTLHPKIDKILDCVIESKSLKDVVFLLMLFIWKE